MRAHCVGTSLAQGRLPEAGHCITHAATAVVGGPVEQTYTVNYSAGEPDVVVTML